MSKLRSRASLSLACAVGPARRLRAEPAAGGRSAAAGRHRGAVRRSRPWSTRTSMSAASSPSIRSRCARACPAISTRCISPTARSSSRATCCSPSTSGRSRPRSTRPAPTWRRRAPTSPSPRRDLARAAAAGARQDHHRADLRPAHPGQARRRGLGRRRRRRRCARPSSTSSSPSCARRSTGRIGDRRVSPGNLVTGGTGGNTTLLATIVSLDPIRFEFTFDEASYLRYERLSQRRQGRDRAATAARRSRSS